MGWWSGRAHAVRDELVEWLHTEHAHALHVEGGDGALDNLLGPARAGNLQAGVARVLVEARGVLELVDDALDGDVTAVVVLLLDRLAHREAALWKTGHIYSGIGDQIPRWAIVSYEISRLT